MNGEVGEVGEAETQIFIDEINEIYNKEFAQRDFERASEKRKEILENLDGENERERESNRNS